MAQKSITIVLTSEHHLLLFFSLGRIFSRWARGGLRLLPPAILAGRAYRGSGGDWYPAHLCVLCLPILPPRLCLTVAGLLLCSQVSCQDLDQPRHPVSVVESHLIIVIVNILVMVKMIVCEHSQRVEMIGSPLWHIRDSVSALVPLKQVQFCCFASQRRCCNLLWLLLNKNFSSNVTQWYTV